MKQLSKLESAIFLLGGVLMVVGAACFAFGFSHPQLVQITSWGFLLGTILFSVMQAMQVYEGSSLVIHRLKRMQYVADIFFVLSGISMVDTVYAFLRRWFENYETYITYFYNKCLDDFHFQMLLTLCSIVGTGAFLLLRRLVCPKWIPDEIRA